MLATDVQVNGLRTVMADDAAPTQLPIMVRRPTMVWSGLDRMDMHRKQIAGDGNCLFASLADQLYGTPEKHLEIRAFIIDHMRNFRPLFEGWTIKDDIQQKRATRAATNAIKNTVSDDAFEDYLSIMCKPGTYGGEPELMAFVQCYDRDVLVHLPSIKGYPETFPYVNQHRPVGAEVKPQLHLCYGGDEITHAHYDSARRNSPAPTQTALTERPKTTQPTSFSILDATNSTKSMSSRAIRGSRSDLSRDLMHDMIVKGSKDLRTSFEDSDRARSPSVTSSHHSSSSKRSFEDEGEPQRARKRADRRKSIRKRGPRESSIPLMSVPKLKLKTFSRTATPQSTQSSDDSSEQSEPGHDIDFKFSQDPNVSPNPSSDMSVAIRSTRKVAPAARQETPAEDTSPILVTERKSSILQA